MHGLIFNELKKYCDTRLGPESWNRLLEQSGMSGRIFLALESYPDRDAIALLKAACRLTGREPSAVLEDFGVFITPDLLRMYASRIRPEWRTLAFLCNVEETIHKVVRHRNPGAEPPQLKCAISGPDQVTIIYASQRKLCALARGLIRGVAHSYAEEVSIAEPSCMLSGSPVCKLIVRATPQASTRA